MVDDVENPTSSAAEENSNIKDESAPSNFQVVTTVPTNEEDDNIHDNVNDDIENPISSAVVVESGVPSEKATDNDDNPTTQTQNEIEVKRNINSYYGHKVGAISTISLILNAGLMIYAHRKFIYCLSCLCISCVELLCISYVLLTSYSNQIIYK